ncbi:MAG: hypothetical protein H6622_02005 [Halobacteriovoraceae bacterium]|nr:hypothetical protein [Halobacteriovoraceae bacterium]
MLEKEKIDGNIQLVRNKIVSQTVKNEIIKALCRVPTGDNCQPFSYKWRGESLLVYHNPKISKHTLNKDQAGSLISLGCIIETVNIVTSHFNISFELKYCLNNPNIDKLWAEFFFYKADRTPIELLQEIQSRTTDRRVYKKKLDQKDFLQIFNRGNLKFERFHIIPADFKFSKLIAKSEEYIWQTPEVYMDLFKWMRLSKSESYYDGMDAVSMGMSPIEKVSFRFFKKYPIIFSFFYKLGMNIMFKLRTINIIKNSGAILLYTNEDPTIYGKIQTGKECYRMWLELTKIGMVAQPLSSASLIAKSALERFPPKEMTAENIKKSKEVINSFIKYADIPKNQVLQWSFRIGYPKSKPMRPICRKSHKDILK